MATTIHVGKPGPSNDGEDPPKILNFKTVASYNWLDEPNPTILVPGIPPIWDPPVICPALLPDTGGRYVDQNADRTPGSPLQALIRAVQTCQPAFDFAKVSIVTDRKPLRCLLSFVLAEPAAFEFSITVIGDTALFTRMEKRTRHCSSIHRHFRKYRSGFEEHYTKVTASAARTTSHHRVVQYEFAGQTILLRYAADAYLDRFMHAECLIGYPPEALVKRHKDTGFQGNPLSKTLPTDTPVAVIKGGRFIPHAATLELTTRAQDSQALDSIARKTPDFWISQTLNYHLCFHRETEEGTAHSTIFDRIRLIPMAELLMHWEETNAEKLRGLKHVLEQIIKAAKALGGSCIVRSDGSQRASLEVSRAEGTQVPALPEDMQRLFLPTYNKTMDILIEQDDITMTDTDVAPEKGSPPAKRLALDANLCTHQEVAGTTQNGKTEATASTVNYDDGRKRKWDTQDALGPDDLPPARKRALYAEYRTPGKASAPMQRQELSATIRDEPLDCEMVM
ncbi:hypothetical protein BDR22DRAFT_959646 [Usnea florida]